MRNETKIKYYVLRLAVRHYIRLYSEDHKIYVYFMKNSDEIFYIDLKLNNIFRPEMNIYETTLKNLYLFLFIQDYSDVEQAFLVYLANKELKRYTTLDIQILLNVSSTLLKRFESGTADFKGPFSFDNLSKKLGFDKSEFNQIFKNCFKKVTNESK